MQWTKYERSTRRPCYNVPVTSPATKKPFALTVDEVLSKYIIDTVGAASVMAINPHRLATASEVILIMAAKSVNH